MKTDKSLKPNIYGSYQPGIDPEQDAWFTAFFIENHLDYYTHPDHAATPEQVRFMVYTEEDDRYYPCSLKMFDTIMAREESKYLASQYQAAYLRVLELVNAQIEDKTERRYLEALLRIKYEHEIKDQIMIPSRLEKRLLRIFMNRTQIEDPRLEDKTLRNRRMAEMLESTPLHDAMNRLEAQEMHSLPKTLSGLRELADYMEFHRLLNLAVEQSLWKDDKNEPADAQMLLQLIRRPIKGQGLQPLLEFLGIVLARTDTAYKPRGKKILWLANESGEIVGDLSLIKYLIHLGHKIIIVLKGGPIYTRACFQDAFEDSVLSRAFEGALLLTDSNLRKNELVQHLKSDYSLIVISDGTREKLNLLLVSTTFARMFKEVDGVISRGSDQKKRFFDTPFQFTQDIYNIRRDKNGLAHIAFKPRHPDIIKFAHADLEKKARSIIERMAEARQKGMTVIFYSGIIGSIPGKIKVAKKIMTTFIHHLEQQSDMTFIINPSEFFEPGMDADDLMYMWEIVQRSGYIDIWRFQSTDDIVQAFSLMKKRVPPEWVGKDATYSTGCTKEMKIALDVLKEHPEMQIIGPAREKFMRRQDYGVGKMYDKRLPDIRQIAGIRSRR